MLYVCGAERLFADAPALELDAEGVRTFQTKSVPRTFCIINSLFQASNVNFELRHIAVCSTEPRDLNLYTKIGMLDN